MKKHSTFALLLALTLGGCLPQQESEDTSGSGGSGGGSSVQTIEIPAATPPPVSENDEPPVVNTDSGPVQAATETTAPIPDVEVRLFRGTSN